MKQELDEQLCRDFPLLYRDRHASMQVTCMCWGFPGDGWYGPIRKLSEKLEALIAALPKDSEVCCASQVKEKFGGLRFYMTYSTPEMDALIDEAEEECSRTCESCGSQGTLRGKDWLVTLCDPCRLERNKK